MAVVQSQSTSCPSSVSQAAAVEALNGPQEVIAARRRAFQDRRDLVIGGLNDIDGIVCPKPQGAFYTYASCARLIGCRTPAGDVIGDDRDFAAYLLDAEVAVVPGSCFGLAPFVRISYATSESELRMAITSIASACERLLRPA